MATMEGRVGKSGSLHILIFSLAACRLEVGTVGTRSARLKARATISN